VGGRNWASCLTTLMLKCVEHSQAMDSAKWTKWVSLKPYAHSTATQLQPSCKQGTGRSGCFLFLSFLLNC
jgi:hypothetical protein